MWKIKMSAQVRLKTRQQLQVSLGYCTCAVESNQKNNETGLWIKWQGGMLRIYLLRASRTPANNAAAFTVEHHRLK